MATWVEIYAHAASTMNLCLDEDDIFAVDLALDGRKQRVFVRRVTAIDQGAIEFRSMVCKSSQLPALEALRVNAGPGLGALCIEDGMYFLAYRIPSQCLSLEQLGLLLGALGRRADGLESNATGGGDVF